MAPTSSPTRRQALRPATLAFTAALALFGPAQHAFAQASTTPSRADPLDARTAVPAVAYSSAFETYRRMGEAPVGSWRDANDTVTKIGGWRAYAREASPAPPALADPSPGAAPEPEPKPPQTGPVGAQGHGHHAPK